MVAFVDKGRPSKNSLIALPRVCVFVMITARTRAAGSSVDALSQELDGSIRLVSNMSHGGGEHIVHLRYTDLLRGRKKKAAREAILGVPKVAPFHAWPSRWPTLRQVLIWLRACRVLHLDDHRLLAEDLLLLAEARCASAHCRWQLPDEVRYSRAPPIAPK